MAKLFFSTMVALQLLILSSVAAILFDPYPFYKQFLLPPPATGPDSIAFDKILPYIAYVGISDGRVLKLDVRNGAFDDFAYTSPTRTNVCDGNTNASLAPTCGKVNGLTFGNSDRILYAVDQNLGLFSIDMNVDQGRGLATLITNTAGDQRFTHLSGVDVDPVSGDVYLIDRNHTIMQEAGGVFGRLVKYDPKTKEVTVIKSGLSFPSGPAVSFDGNFVLIPQRQGNNILKYYIKGLKVNQSEVITLPGTPRKVKRATTIGNYWVAIDKQDVPSSSITTPIAYEFSSFRGTKLITKDVSQQYPNTVINEIQETNSKTIYVGSQSANYITRYSYFL